MTRSTVLLCAVLVVVLLSAPASSQHLYFSSAPNACYPGIPVPGDYQVYVHSPDDGTFVGAAFTLELNAFAWTDLVSYVPAAGVTVVSLGMAPGSGTFPLTAVIELSWSPRPLEHEPVFTFTFGGSSGYGPSNIYDAGLVRPGGGSEPATGVTTEFINVDCFDACLSIDVPPVIDVPVGSPTTTVFSWLVSFWTLIGGDLVLSDDLGWLQSWSPSGVWGGNNCGDCFFDWEQGDFTVLAPAGTAPGTESTLTFTPPPGFCGEQTVTLRADAPVPTEPSTWGKIKALFD